MSKLEELLDNEGWKPQSIGIVTKYLSNYKLDLDDYTSNLEKAFDYLGFAGLTSDQIEIYFINNVESLRWKDTEFLKLAAVFEYIDINDNVFKSNRAIGRVSEYKKLYIRYLTLERTGLLTNTYTVLTDGDKRAYSGELYLHKAITLMFKDKMNYNDYMGITSDEELEKAYSILSKTKNYIDIRIMHLTRNFYERYRSRKKRLAGNMVSNGNNGKQTSGRSI